MLSALIAMQQADAAFPSGAFAFSNGVEGLASLAYPFDAAALHSHADATIRHRWAGTERVALLQAYRATGDIARLAVIDQSLEAATLVEPLRNGSRRAGRAFLASHVRLGSSHATRLRDAIAAETMIGHLPVIQGCLWQALGLSESEAAGISGYQTVAGLVSAAVRLGRIGAIDAQAIVRDLLPLIAGLSSNAPDLDPGDIVFSSFVPFMEIAAMRGASADLRLFAN